MEINITYNTKDKTVICKKGDEVVEDFAEIVFYKSWDDDKKYSMSMVTRKKNSDEGSTETYHLQANADGDFIEQKSKTMGEYLKQTFLGGVK